MAVHRRAFVLGIIGTLAMRIWGNSDALGQPLPPPPSPIPSTPAPPFPSKAVAEIANTPSLGDIHVAAYSTYTVAGRVFKARTVTMEVGSSIEMTELANLEWIALVIETLDVKGKCSILRSNDHQFLNGHTLAETPVNGASVSGDGANGRDGLEGTPGGDALTTPSMPDTYLFIKNVTYQGHTPSGTEMSDLTINFRGLNGGDGDKGNPGGSGSNGVKGRASASVDGIFAGYCDHGPGWGGNGGNAGSGGVGGWPGHGGDASPIFVWAGGTAVGALKAANFETWGGQSGRLGARGDSGNVGHGAPEGDPTKWCRPAGRAGHDGIIHPPCFTRKWEPELGKPSYYNIWEADNFNSLGI